MPKINKRFYHKVKKSELEDTVLNYRKRNQYENITFAPDIQKIKNFHFSKMLKSVFVPGTVNEIEDSCFSDCEKLEEVILSEGITYLGNFAFSNCKSLKRITIPESVKSIGNFCFLGCLNLEEVILQKGLETIGDRCFWNCEKLKKIDIPSSVNSLGIECFGQCRNLKIIVLPINCLKIPSHVFRYCNNIKKVNYQSLNVEFLMTIKERLKKEKRTETVEQISKEVAEKLFYFGKCKLLGIDYKQEYEEFIEYYMNTYTIPNKDIVSLDKNSCLNRQDNGENKLIPWYAQQIPGFIISEYLNNDNNNKEVEPLDYVSQSLEYNPLPKIIDEKYYFDKKGNLWIKGENDKDDDIMPKPFVKEYILKNNK